MLPSRNWGCPVPPERTCPNCGEPWPKLTLHVCPIEPNLDNESLVGLLWDVMLDGVPITIGELSINVQVATVIARPLARQLMSRKADLIAALAEGD